MELTTDINTYFRSHKIQPSYQRLRIFDYLLKHKTHPTVDTIYQALVEEIPSLSKTTVYNTLKIFVEKKIAQAITIDEGETRYDADMLLHGHFKCNTCGSVFDIDTELPNINLKQLKDFSIQEYHIYLKGLCNKCKLNIN